MFTNALNRRIQAARAYLDAHGWTQGEEQDHGGAVCLTGAVRLCAPQTGDEYIIRAVLRHKERAEEWNDEDGRTQEEVASFLASFEVTDADLKGTFGPRWEAVVQVVRQAASLTHEQAEAIRTAQAEAQGKARVGEREAALDAVWCAAWGAARDGERDAAWGAAQSAVRAEVVKDLISPECYEVLAGPWRAMFPAVEG